LNAALHAHAHYVCAQFVRLWSECHGTISIDFDKVSRVFRYYSYRDMLIKAHDMRHATSIPQVFHHNSPHPCNYQPVGIAHFDYRCPVSVVGVLDHGSFNWWKIIREQIL
jgi:hypothetical protein